MKWRDRTILRISYLFTSKQERERHVRELEHLLIESQNSAGVLQDRLNDFLRTPLREREKQPDFMKSGSQLLRDILAENLKTADSLKERIEIIHPSFPKAHLRRKR